jgi:amino acid transporter
LGFQVGWWSWLNLFVDVAVYPALFADYLRIWRPEMTAVERWVIALGFVWLLTALNLTGVRITGWGAVALAVGALAPIVALTGVAVARAHVVPWSPFAAPGQGLLSGLGLGIAVMMWNYSGWDMPSTVLGETQRPETAYRRALWWALPLIALANIVPVAATLSATEDWQRWQTGQWLAAAAGGRRLAHAVVTGGYGTELSLSRAPQFPVFHASRCREPAALARRSHADGRPVGGRARVECRLQPLRLASFKG